MNLQILLPSLLFMATNPFPGSSNSSDYKVEKSYTDLRSMVLTIKPESIGLKVTSEKQVWGILMETGYPGFVTSLVALADGTVSLYLSNGGGIIGLGTHDGPKRSAKEFLSTSQTFSTLAAITYAFPLPSPGSTRFYFLTTKGVLTLEAPNEALEKGKHSLSSLFLNGHNLITEVRKVDELLRSKKSLPTRSPK